MGPLRPPFCPVSYTLLDPLLLSLFRSFFFMPVSFFMEPDFVVGLTNSVYACLGLFSVFSLILQKISVIRHYSSEFGLFLPLFCAY